MAMDLQDLKPLNKLEFYIYPRGYKAHYFMFLNSKNISASAQHIYIQGNFEKLSVYEANVGKESPKISW